MSKELKAMQDISDVRKKEIEEALKLLKTQGIVFESSKPKEPMRISFDFDSTLDQKPMQELCKKFMGLGAEIYVTTSRGKTMHSGIPLNNDDLFELTDRLNIKRDHITFTQYDDKYSFVKDMDMHFDDDIHEIYLINQFPGKCIGCLFEQKPDGIIEY